MLDVEELSVAYDRTKVVHEVSFHIEEGSCRALIGPNGAGKSSLLNALSGRIKSESGRVRFRGEDITNVRADRIAALGLAMSPQERQIFTRLTVRENLLMGAYRFRGDQSRIQSRLAYVLDIFPKLEILIDRKGAGLSGGEQQMVAIGRALMSDPELLILDEPSAALAPVIVETIFGVIARLRSEGEVTMLIAEQNVAKAAAVADQVLVLARGQVQHDGSAAEFAGHDDVIEAYLGSGSAPVTSEIE